MARGLALFGLGLALFFPLVCGIGLVAYSLMGCSGGGSLGAVHGCHLFGFEINFLAQYATLAFVASFITVPIGIALCLLALVIAVISDFRDNK
jgi:hypothetical protein